MFILINETLKFKQESVENIIIWCPGIRCMHLRMLLSYDHKLFLNRLNRDEVHQRPVRFWLFGFLNAFLYRPDEERCNHKSLRLN